MITTSRLNHKNQHDFQQKSELRLASETTLGHPDIKVKTPLAKGPPS